MSIGTIMLERVIPTVAFTNKRYHFGVMYSFGLVGRTRDLPFHRSVILSDIHRLSS